MEFSQLIQDRYSCRSFSATPVEEEKLQKIIEAGIYAPTARNQQPFRIFSMRSQEAKDIIRTVTKCHFGADCFLVIGAEPQAGFQREFDGRDYADIDAAIAATHMMLEIHNQGLGSTWVGCFDAPKLQVLCPQMAGLDLIAIFPIGYPAEDAAPSPRHSQRKAPEELVTKL